jgi:hypothetical protein
MGARAARSQGKPDSCGEAMNRIEDIIKRVQPSNKKPEPEQEAFAVKRNCLSCERRFTASSPYLRLCPCCRNRVSSVSQDV